MAMRVWLVVVFVVLFVGGVLGRQHGASSSQHVLDASTEAEAEAEAEAEVDTATAHMTEAQLAVHAQALIDAAQSAEAEAEAEADGDDDGDGDDAYPNCNVCIKTLAGVKDGGAGHAFGYNFGGGGRGWDMTTICNALWKKDPEMYAPCHQTLYAIRNNGRSVMYWLTHGCYEKYIYGQKHHVSQSATSI